VFGRSGVRIAHKTGRSGRTPRRTAHTFAPEKRDGAEDERIAAVRLTLDDQGKVVQAVRKVPG
jgi:hypothetical protein